MNRELAVIVLERMGHSVESVWNGVEAVARWKAGGIDVILMDIQMPLMDGMEATAEIRRLESGTGEHVPIVGLTAHEMQSDRDSALASGMDGYLTKPLQAEDMRQVIASFNANHGRELPNSSSEFDFSAPLKSLGGDIVALHRLVELYLSTTPPLVERIQESFRRADAPALAYAAHTLKGSLSQMGNAPARELAAEVESLARVGKLSEAGNALDRLEKCLTEFDSSVRGWCQPRG